MLSKFRQAFYTIAGASNQANVEGTYDYSNPGQQQFGRVSRSSSFRGRFDLSPVPSPGATGSSKEARKNSRSDSVPSLPGTDSLKFKYWRPVFLQLKTDDEIIVSADKQIRPIILPRDNSRLPWNSGYAETINAGKSLRNEDQANFYCDNLIIHITSDDIALLVRDLSSLMDPIYELSPEGQIIWQRKGRAARVSRSISMIETTSSQRVPMRSKPEALPETILEDIKSAIIEDPKTETNENLEQSEFQGDNIVTNSQSSSPVDLLPSFEDEKQLPWVYFGMFDGHAGSAVAVAAANTLHNIIAERLNDVSMFLLALSSEEIERERRMQNEWRELEELSEPTDNHNVTTFNPSYSNGNNNNKDHVHKPIVSYQELDEAQQRRQRAIESRYEQLNILRIGLNARVTIDNLVVGALESSFWAMDELIGRDKHLYKMPGGCTALVAIFILGKLYVSNAGDSRAVVYKQKQVVPMSFDFTPNSERDRIKKLGLQCPQFLGNEFTHLEFFRKPTRQDIGKPMLYKDAFMTGWSYKTITHDDLKFPLIYGEGKRSRVLATIGVTRGFGDHELKAQHSNVHIKPFLTPEPEVKILSLADCDDLTCDDVLIMGTDGLWDVTTNTKAVEIVQKSFDQFPGDGDSKYRYISAAQDLVMHARGHHERCKGWRALDDISVFVIPLKPYCDEYNVWKKSLTLI